MSRRKKRDREVEAELEAMRELLAWLELEDPRICPRCGANLVHDEHRLSCTYFTDAELVHRSFGAWRRFSRRRFEE
jgi:hypothetical protein